MKLFVLAAMLMTACATTSAPKSIKEVNVGTSYNITHESLSDCQFMPLNIITALPAQGEDGIMQAQPIGALAQTQGMLFGIVDCSKSMNDKNAKAFDAMPFEAIKAK